MITSFVPVVNVPMDFFRRDGVQAQERVRVVVTFIPGFQFHPTVEGTIISFRKGVPAHLNINIEPISHAISGDNIKTIAR
ncbi:hypothetical protein D3C75_991310 [compost metagenome]